MNRFANQGVDAPSILTIFVSEKPANAAIKINDPSKTKDNHDDSYRRSHPHPA